MTATSPRRLQLQQQQRYSRSNLGLWLLIVLLGLWQAQASDDVLRLGIRSVSHPRDVVIHLTWRSLGLVVWLSLGIIVLYETLTTWLILLSGWYSTKKKKKKKKNNQRNEGELGMIESGRGGGSDDLDADWGHKSDMIPPRAQMVNTIVWGIATAYGVFYSFEVVFLYINDQWYQLLSVQLLFFTLPDLVVWIWVIGHTKYQLWSNTILWAKFCIAIKFNHIVFNLLMEKGIFTLCHWFFCLEDLTCLLLPIWGGLLLPLYNKNHTITTTVKPLAISTGIFLVLIMGLLPTRVT